MALPLLAALATIIGTEGTKAWLTNRQAGKDRKAAAQAAAGSALSQSLGRQGGAQPTPQSNPMLQLLNSSTLDEQMRDRLFQQIFGRLLSSGTGAPTAGAPMNTMSKFGG